MNKLMYDCANMTVGRHNLFIMIQVLVSLVVCRALKDQILHQGRKTKTLNYKNMW